jgi:hypothetical protein
MTNLFLQIDPASPTVVHSASDRLVEGVQGIGQWFGLTGYALNIIGGLLLLIVGYFVAKFFGGLIKNILKRTGIDERTSGQLSVSRFAGKLVYYLLMIVVLMATLSMMGVSGDVLAPLNQMTGKFFGAVPDIIAAGIIAYVGYFLAKIVADIVEASGDKIRGLLPKFSNENDKNQFDDNLKEVNRDFNTVASTRIDVVKVLKNLAFIFVFIPILIIALEKLNMQVITKPATNMLDTFIGAIPSIVYAVIILFAAGVGGRFLTGLLKDLLNSFNVNILSEKLNLNKILGNTNLVNLLGNLAYFFIIYIGIEEAAKQLELYKIVEIMDEVLVVGGKIVFGLIILALGNVVANFTTGIFLSGENTNRFSASIVRGAIIIIFLAMGLHAMGIADNIIELSFGLGLGAIAVAFALAFGLGGREAAGQEVKDFFSKLRKKD